MALLDLQGLEAPTSEFATDSSNSKHSCAGSDVSLALCGNSDVSLLICD
ncbi:SapB/AmfS family lanthipeptide [Actinomycetes bacterium KLBMP 9797]